MRRNIESLDSHELDRLVLEIQRLANMLPNQLPIHSRCLGLSALLLQLKYTITRSLDDLNQSITVQETIVTTLMPHYHPFRMYPLSNLGTGLYYRAQATQSIADLNQAIAYGTEGAAVIPTDHPLRAPHLYTLGNSLILRSRWQNSD